MSSVSLSTRVSLIFAGWLPQDGTFDSELAAGLEIERNLLGHNMVAHRTGAGHSQTLADTGGGAHPDSCVLVSQP